MNKPNILFILLDDMGWKDLSCYGSEFYETPRIDALAREGVRFENAYAACPVCSPSRASIMTGKYPARVGLTDFLVSNAKGKLIDAPYVHHLPLNEYSLASALRDGNYQTWHVGKWHLGEEPYYPEKQGFDVNIGGCEFGLPRSGYFSPYNIPTLPNGPEGEYLTDRITDEAIRLIENRDTSKPFFMNLCHYAVHVPIQAPNRALVEKYKQKAKRMGLDKQQTFAEGDFFPCEHKKDKRIVRRLIQSDPEYAAMIENLDDNVGRVIDALKEQGIYDNTIIIFTSDNGGLATAEGSPTCNLPSIEGKGWMYDGGVHVPLIVAGTEAVARGITVDALFSSPDFYPTLLHLAGLERIPSQHVDGFDCSDALLGKSYQRPPMFWHYPHYGNQGGMPGCAVRDGDYKLLHFFEDDRDELYDIAHDPSEQNNLIAEKCEMAAKLKETLNKWLEDVEAQIPTENPEFKPWREGGGSGRDVELPFDLNRYDADVYYGKNLGNFH